MPWLILQRCGMSSGPGSLLDRPQSVTDDHCGREMSGVCLQYWGIFGKQSSRAKCHGAPSISIFLRMLGINQYCSYVINIRWDAFN